MLIAWKEFSLKWPIMADDAAKTLVQTFRLISPGLLQRTPVWHLWRSDSAAAVGAKCGSATRHWSWSARSHHTSTDYWGSFTGCLRENTCVVPRTQSPIGDSSFTVARPWLWNGLPLELRQWDREFRRLLKTPGGVSLRLRRIVTFGAMYKLTHSLTH